MHATAALLGQPRPVEVALAIPTDIHIDQLVRCFEAQESPQFDPAVLHLVHDHTGIKHRPEPRHAQGRRDAKRSRGAAVDLAQPADEIDRRRRRQFLA